MVEFNFVSFILGIIVGVAIREAIFQISRYIKGKGNAEIKVPVSGNVIASVVTLIWAISMLVEMMSAGTYSTSPLVHGLMGGIVGFYFKPILTGDKK